MHALEVIVALNEKAAKGELPKRGADCEVALAKPKRRAPRVVAECWTCDYRGNAKGLTSAGSVEWHRSAGHDVREVKG